MKTLINFFICLIAVTATGLFSYGAYAAQDFSRASKIRVVEIDASSHQNEYNSALESDPWHGFNYAMFRFNDAIDQVVITPVARAYRFVVPQWGRDRVTNIFNNLEEPSNFVNSLLQGDIEGMFRSFWRFVINSTFGIGGMGDVAGGFGLAEKDRSFSQTLAVYGIGSGPYLVMPLLGPSTPRDLVSMGAASATNPVSYTDSPYPYIAMGIDGIQTREGLLDLTDDMRKNSFDLYSSYKSSYLQHRKEKVLKNIAE